MGIEKVGGVIIPMVTAIHSYDGENATIDEPMSDNLIDKLIENGAGTLFVFGYAGACDKGIPVENRKAHLEHVIEHVNGRVPVVVGVSHDNLDKAVELAQHAEMVGATAMVLLLNQAKDDYGTQVEKIFNATDSLPLILYNNPFIGQEKNLQPDQVRAMIEQYPGRIVGLKESSGNTELFEKFIHLQKELEKSGISFKLFMGDAKKISWIIENQEYFDFELPGAVPVEANNSASVEGYQNLLRGLPAEKIKYLTIPAVIELLCDQGELDPLTLAFWNGFVKFSN